MVLIKRAGKKRLRCGTGTKRGMSQGTRADKEKKRIFWCGGFKAGVENEKGGTKSLQRSNLGAEPL